MEKIEEKQKFVELEKSERIMTLFVYERLYNLCNDNKLEETIWNYQWK